MATITTKFENSEGHGYAKVVSSADDSIFSTQTVVKFVLHDRCETCFALAKADALEKA